MKGASPLLIQYGDEIYNYSSYVRDLVTDLNVTGDASVIGNITGPDNMRLNVKSGALTLAGTADVTSVAVSKGGALFGGSYIARDMKDHLIDGETDTQTGVFSSDGLLIPDGADMQITAESAFVSNGSMAVVLKDEETAYAIVVKSPLINVDDTSLAAEEGGAYQPGVKYTFLKAAGSAIGGDFLTKAGDDFTDLLDVRELKNEGSSAWVMLGIDDDDIEDEDEQVVVSELGEMLEEEGTDPDSESSGSSKPDEGGSTKPDEGGSTKPDEGGSTKPDEGGSTKPDEGSGQPSPGLSPSEKKPSGRFSARRTAAASRP